MHHSHAFEIEEELWFGEGSDRDAETLARASGAFRLGCEAAEASFSRAAQRLLELPREEAAEPGALVATLATDPVLCARVVRLANSAAFSGAGSCATVGEAATLLGTRAVSEIAIAAAMFEAVHNGRPAVSALRDHSASVASLARYLALQTHVHVDDVYAAALLHDVAKLFLWQADEDLGATHEYAHLLEESDGVRDYSFILERRRYGFDHAILSGLLLKAWRLPEPIPTVVRLHHNPARAYDLGGRIEPLVSLVRLADRLAYDLQRSAEQLLPAGADKKLVHDVGLDESATALGLEEKRVKELWDELEVAYVEGHTLFAEADGHH